MIATKSVLQLEAADPHTFKQHIHSRSPVQAHGLIHSWPALSWTFASLCEQFGDRKVKVLLDLPKTGGILPGGQESYEKSMLFKDFVHRLQNCQEAPCYLGYSKAGDLLRERVDSYDFSSLTPSTKYPTDTRLWIGSSGTCSGLHTDLKDNIFAQIIGTKKVFLVPLHQTHLVYPFIDNIVNSRVNPEHFDSHVFPKFLKADIYETVVGPGDILFIPRGWWHYLRSQEPSISINHWFGPPVSAWTYLALLLRLGPSYVGRTVVDLFQYSIFGKTYRKEFFFTPQSTGERLFNLIRYGDFSKENDPVNDKKGKL